VASKAIGWELEMKKMLRRVQKWLWDVPGLSCQEATRLAAHGMDRPLILGERARLLLHTLLCAYCKNYVRQLGLLRTWARRFGAPNFPSIDDGMPPASASRVKKRLESESSRAE
jgi:hypothetical protein